jgi:uncharacterized protein (DUF2062 family)
MRRTLKGLVQHLLKEHNSPERMGWAVALGLFLGCLPLYGVHLPLCIAFAWLLKLNKATVYLAANISNPLFAPVLIAVEVLLGEWVRFGHLRPIDLAGARGFGEQANLLARNLPDLFLSCMLGGTLLGLLLAAIGGPAVYWFCSRRSAGR